LKKLNKVHTPAPYLFKIQFNNILLSMPRPDKCTFQQTIIWIENFNPLRCDV